MQAFTRKYFLKKVCCPNFSYVHIVSNSFLLQEAFPDCTEGVPDLANTSQSDRCNKNTGSGKRNQILYFQIKIGTYQLKHTHISYTDKMILQLISL